jgi:uncharacterized OB-fold protein
MFTPEKLPVDQKYCGGKRGLMSMPFRYYAGLFLSKALIALRDEKKILASRCPRCGRVFMPPRSRCERDFAKITEFVAVGPGGVVDEFTVVYYDEPYFLEKCEHMMKAPFTMALIKLDGADTKLLHRVKGTDIKKGDRVKPKWAAEPTAAITDIEYFEKG